MHGVVAIDGLAGGGADFKGLGPSAEPQAGGLVDIPASRYRVGVGVDRQECSMSEEERLRRNVYKVAYYT